MNTVIYGSLGTRMVRHSLLEESYELLCRQDQHDAASAVLYQIEALWIQMTDLEMRILNRYPKWNPMFTSFDWL